MTEPTTDAPHRPIDVQSILDRLRIIEGGTIETVTLRPGEARAILDHIGAYAEHCAVMEARVANERTLRATAESARDAALARAEKAEEDADEWLTYGLACAAKLPRDMPTAELQAGFDEIAKLRTRAMPEAVLMETVEQVEAMPAGLYLQVMPDGGWVIREKEDAVHWTMRPALGRALVGPIPLPDLPIPTPGDAP